jgi:hydrogenase nickel incorporation protein HypA/HybF
MHELSIALSIVEMAAEEVERRLSVTHCGEVQVKAVHLRLGALAGVVKEALLFSYDLACQGTRLEGSRLVIEEVPVVIYCSACGAERPSASFERLCCSVCGAASSQVVCGNELEVVALEVQ